MDALNSILWEQPCEKEGLESLYIKGGNYVRGVGLLVEILVSVLHGSFVCLILLTLKLYLKGIIFELHWRRPPTDILSLISRSQPQKLVSQEELVSVCNILAEALLGNDKATSRGLWKYRWFLCWWQGVLSSSRLMNLLFSHSRLLGCLVCGGCYFRKWKEIQQHCLWCGYRIPCWPRVPESCVSSIKCPLFKHLHLSLQHAVSSREAITAPLSCSPGIEAQFGLFVIFKNQICPGTRFQQQMFLLYVLFKDI